MRISSRPVSLRKVPAVRRLAVWVISVMVSRPARSAARPRALRRAREWFREADPRTAGQRHVRPSPCHGRALYEAAAASWSAAVRLGTKTGSRPLRAVGIRVSAKALASPVRSPDRRAAAPTMSRQISAVLIEQRPETGAARLVRRFSSIPRIARHGGARRREQRQLLLVQQGSRQVGDAGRRR